MIQVIRTQPAIAVIRLIIMSVPKPENQRVGIGNIQQVRLANRPVAWPVLIEQIYSGDDASTRIQHVHKEPVNVNRIAELIRDFHRSS